MSPLERTMLDNIGSRATLGVFAVMYFVLGSTASAAAQPARKLNKKRSYRIVQWKDFKEPMFVLFFVFNLLMATCSRLPMMSGPQFSATLGYSMATSSNLLAAVSGVGIVSRPAFGWVADKTGHQNSLAISTGLYALGVFAIWFPAAQHESKALWVFFSVIVGMVNGSFLQFTTSMAQRVFGDEVYYCYSGLFLAARGVGTTIGNPMGGALIARVRDDELRGTDFNRAILFTGFCLTACTICLVCIRWLDARKTGWKLWW